MPTTDRIMERYDGKRKIYGPLKIEMIISDNIIAFKEKFINKIHKNIDARAKVMELIPRCKVLVTNFNNLNFDKYTKEDINYNKLLESLKYALEIVTITKIQFFYN